MPETTQPLNVLSLFSGIPTGGLELGLERAGMRTVGQVEIDDYCRRVLAKHWPDVPRHDDVRTAADWWFSTERPTVDVICGGFPCQDISAAGRRAGIIDGEKSSLWTYLAHTVRVLRPRYVVVENVPRILVRGRDGVVPVGVVAADLAAIGYDLRWDCVPAASVGAPHLRDRWFGVAYPHGGQLRIEPVGQSQRRGAPLARPDGPAQPLADPAQRGGQDEQEGSRPGIPVRAVAGAGRGVGRGLDSPRDRGHRGRTSVMASDVGHADSARPADLQGCSTLTGRAGFRTPDRSSWWDVEPSMGRVVDGLPAKLDRARRHALGNAVVPQVAEHVGRLILGHASSLRASA